MSTTDSHHKHAVRQATVSPGVREDRPCATRRRLIHRPLTALAILLVCRHRLEVLLNLGGHSAQVKPNTSFRKRTIAAAVAVSTASLSLVPAFSAFAAGPKAPGSLKVERVGDGQELSISWRSVQNIDHYTVTVFDGKKDVSQVVDAKTDTMTVKAPGTCTRYQVRVAAVDADGATASTGTYRIAPLAPRRSQQSQPRPQCRRHQGGRLLGQPA